MSTRPAITSRHRGLVAAVLVALVLVQSLGVLHRFAHPGRGDGVASVEKAPAGWLKALFVGHDHDGAACDLYDQLSHADALWSAAPQVIALALPVATAEPHRDWHLAAQSAGFLARGPPALA